jgi:hypothetical protein
MSANLNPVTYIDRDGARWTVKEFEYKGQPVLRLRVVEPNERPKQVIFHKADADMLIAMIEHAKQ